MIVDDSLLQRAVLRKTIEDDKRKRFEVVATAKNGKDALEKLDLFDIDVVTMDIEMPEMNGIETLRRIMNTTPKPVIMISSLTKEGARETIESLSIGAIDFIEKPQIDTDMLGLRERLYEKLINATKANKKVVKNRYYKMLDENNKTKVKIKKEKINEKSLNQEGKLSNIVLIGCSTGGPGALNRVLTQIPKTLPACFLVVQHMPEGRYIENLANQIDAYSYFNIKEAKDGVKLSDGNVYIAPGGMHLEIFKRKEDLYTTLSKKAPMSGFRPSVDALFNSVAKISKDIPICASVLTGMGGDGLNGSIALKRKGVPIIAESEQTSIIYGMPKKIVDAGLADYIEDLDSVMARITKVIL